MLLLQCPRLIPKLDEIGSPSRSWLNNIANKLNIRIISEQKLEIERKFGANSFTIFKYLLYFKDLLNRPPELILNMDETIISSRKRLKVLAKKFQLPLTSYETKLPHLTGVITISATGKFFDPIVIVPNLKRLSSISQMFSNVYFCSSFSGWMTKNLFLYYCLNIISQISIYRLQLPKNLRDELILLIVDGHPSRSTFLACYILHLFNIDLLLLPPHTSHIMQPFDISMAAPLKIAFNKSFHFLTSKTKMSHIEINKKLSSRELRNAMIESFLNSLRISGTPTNIINGFKSSGIYPFNPNEPIESPYCTNFHEIDIELSDLWINSQDNLKKLFIKENGWEPTTDLSVNLQQIAKNLLNSDIASGRGLSILPDIILEESGLIKRIEF